MDGTRFNPSQDQAILSPKQPERPRQPPSLLKSHLYRCGAGRWGR